VPWVENGSIVYYRDVLALVDKFALS
jgi:hypothetical protein